LTGRKEGSAGLVRIKNGTNPYAGTSGQQPRANIHPTVKPIEIMEWCARDIAPNSKVVDPFLGSGTTGVAMSRLGHDFVGIELNPEYAEICEARIRHWAPIGTEVESEAGVGEAEEKEGEMYSLF
jgi:DNA modification methylase